MCKLQCALRGGLDLLSSISSRFSFAYAIVVFFMGFVVAQSAGAGTLDDVRSRDKLICGVSEGLPGFSEKDGSGIWRGFDVDFCKAVAAAVLGDTGKVEYVPLSATARFEALTDRRIDLLSRNSTWTMSRDLELGIEFAGVSYFDGQGFLVPTLFGASSALQLNGARICVASGTTSEQNAAEFFQNKIILKYPSCGLINGQTRGPLMRSRSAMCLPVTAPHWPQNGHCFRRPKITIFCVMSFPRSL
jgi:ABC-type amino acid transport substrate-binding protein